MGWRRSGSVFIDSPDAGCLEGVSSVTSSQRVPRVGGEHEWIMRIWFCMGQNFEGPIPEGASGAAVWTGGGDVVGFCGYAPVEGKMKGWASRMAADALNARELELVGMRVPPNLNGLPIRTAGWEGGGPRAVPSGTSSCVVLEPS